MLKFLPLIVSTIAFAANTTTIIRTNGDSHRFPIQYIDSYTNRPLSGFASFLVGFGMNYLVEAQGPNPLDICSSSRRSSGFRLLANESVGYMFGENLIVPELAEDISASTLQIGAGPRSHFANQVSGFLLTHNTIVLNPEPAYITQLAYRGEVYYARHVESPEWIPMVGSVFWGVETAVQVVSSNRTLQTVRTDDIPSGQFVHCAIETLLPGRIRVPSRVIDDLLYEFDRMGVSYIRDTDAPWSIHIHNVNDTTFDLLPRIEYVIRTEDGSQIQIASIEPYQYIEPTNDPNIDHVLLHDSPVRFPDMCFFNSLITDNLLIHFDSQNNRIGFGEPL